MWQHRLLRIIQKKRKHKKNYFVLSSAQEGSSQKKAIFSMQHVQSTFRLTHGFEAISPLIISEEYAYFRISSYEIGHPGNYLM